MATLWVLSFFSGTKAESWPTQFQSTKILWKILIFQVFIHSPLEESYDLGVELIVHGWGTRSPKEEVGNGKLHEMTIL